MQFDKIYSRLVVIGDIFSQKIDVKVKYRHALWTYDLLSIYLASSN